MGEKMVWPALPTQALQFHELSWCMLETEDHDSYHTQQKDTMTHVCCCLGNVGCDAKSISGQRKLALTPPHIALQSIIDPWMGVFLAGLVAWVLACHGTIGNETCA